MLVFKDLSYLAPEAGCYFRGLMLLVHCFPPPQRLFKDFCYCLSIGATVYFQRALISRGLAYCLSWNESGLVRLVQVLLNEQECLPVRKEPTFVFPFPSSCFSPKTEYSISVNTSASYTQLAPPSKIQVVRDFTNFSGNLIYTVHTFLALFFASGTKHPLGGWGCRKDGLQRRQNCVSLGFFDEWPSYALRIGALLFLIPTSAELKVHFPDSS